MKKLAKLLTLSKRQKFVFAVLFLSTGVFISEFLSGYYLVMSSIVLSLLTVGFLYFAVRDDIADTFSYPIFILPALFTLSFVLFYPLVPARLFTRIIITAVYAFGLYSLFLTQNIFAVSTIKTINLMRSARIVSFVLTIIVLFLLLNVAFSIRLPFYISFVVVFFFVLSLSFQSLWSYSSDKESGRQMTLLAALIALSLSEISLVLTMWPINASIYSIFLTGIFYSYSGVIHAWIEKRLFKGVLWEYLWVGFLAVLILIIFAKWGI